MAIRLRDGRKALPGGTASDSTSSLRSRITNRSARRGPAIDRPNRVHRWSAIGMIGIATVLLLISSDALGQTYVSYEHCKQDLEQLRAERARLTREIEDCLFRGQYG